MTFLNTKSKADINSLNSVEREENARNLDAIKSLDDVYKTYKPIHPTITWFESSSTSTLKAAPSTGESNDLQESLAKNNIFEHRTPDDEAWLKFKATAPRPDHSSQLQSTNYINENHFADAFKENVTQIRITSGEVEKTSQDGENHLSNNSMEPQCSCNMAPNQMGNAMQFMQPGNSQQAMIASDYYAQQMAMQLSNPIVSYGGYGQPQFLKGLQGGLSPEDYYNYAQLQQHLQNVHSVGQYQGMQGMQGMQNCPAMQSMQGMQATPAMQRNFLVPGPLHGQYNLFPSMEGGNECKCNAAEASIDIAADTCERSGDDTNYSGHIEEINDNLSCSDSCPVKSKSKSSADGDGSSPRVRVGPADRSCGSCSSGSCHSCPIHRSASRRPSQETIACSTPSQEGAAYGAERPQICPKMGGSFEVPEFVGTTPQCRVGRSGPRTSRFNFLEINPCRNMCCERPQPPTPMPPPQPMFSCSSMPPPQPMSSCASMPPPSCCPAPPPSSYQMPFAAPSGQSSCCSPTPETCACSGNCLDIECFLQKMRAVQQQQQQQCYAAMPDHCPDDRFQRHTVYTADYRPFCGPGNCFNHFPNSCSCDGCPPRCEPPLAGGCNIQSCPCEMPISGCCEPSYSMACPCPAPFPATCCHPCFAPCAVPYLSNCPPPCAPPCPGNGADACFSSCPLPYEMPADPSCGQTTNQQTQCSSYQL
ncbi:hypothetical protein KR044_000597 [Drosophila immigrans]|nr:hypothetical protein KR044_000597 [Drosophila immigrans]